MLKLIKEYIFKYIILPNISLVGWWIIFYAPKLIPNNHS